MLGQSISGAQSDPAVQSVMQLLALLSDPEKATARLREIELASQKAASDRETANAAIAEAKELTAEAKKRVDESNVFESRIKESQKQLNAAVSRLDDEKKKVAAANAEASAKLVAEQARLDAVAVALQKRETAVMEVEKVVADAVKTQKRYEQKLDALDSVLKGG